MLVFIRIHLLNIAFKPFEVFLLWVIVPERVLFLACGGHKLRVLDHPIEYFSLYQRLLDLFRFQLIDHLVLRGEIRGFLKFQKLG